MPRRHRSPFVWISPSSVLWNVPNNYLWIYCERTKPMKLPHFTIHTSYNIYKYTCRNQRSTAACPECVRSGVKRGSPRTGWPRTAPAWPVCCSWSSSGGRPAWCPARSGRPRWVGPRPSARRCRLARSCPGTWPSWPSTATRWPIRTASCPARPSSEGSRTCGQIHTHAVSTKLQLIGNEPRYEVPRIGYNQHIGCWVRYSLRGRVWCIIPTGYDQARWH